jgi:DNA-binding MarR family transcriptional regulator
MLTNHPISDPTGEVRRGPFGSEDPAQLAELLVRSARRLQRSSMAELGPMGLTGAKARVIRYLEAAGHPVRMADIAAGLEVVPRTATSIVDDLELARLVMRAMDPRDRRSILVSLTPDGALLLDRVAQARRRTAEATFSRLSPAERAELTRMLATLCDCGGPGDKCAPAGPQSSHTQAKRGR